MHAVKGARLRRASGAAALAAALAAGFGAHAQSMMTNSAEFNAGYGRHAGQENRPVDVTTRDANGNRVVVDGLILTGEDQSSFARAGGAADAFAGVGALGGGATAIGNNLVVVTQGSNNTVIVNSSQVNTGPVTATTQLNGGVSGDGQ
ncbi:holdfast anchoring protein HfaA [Phenylobacterium sp.]|jgi:holdfast attachment protein HfaA|uniref:holdfast anchoring protein HfaA n=1 Tax=Phenylobacterium sp. TaxID=1871053 RepID=UPI002E374F2E|nr:holdfast anchoring protein HfaA [Phenylobacterium sp.]HEX2558738.1 holdfast anchoring protein HfaA [Phenylobacterium sp.]